MAEDQMLERTNRMNLLYDFYGTLLTSKQQSILALYYQDNYSLGEIATELSVTRQAVYEHLKRAEQTLEDYESKLRMADQYARRADISEQLQQLIMRQKVEFREELLELLEQLQTIDDSNKPE
ncbi:YlxM family DNA-binding protein [Gorillibacterium sp. sgz5001074]|uniref:YlxM family DNA-binding protein n=1 Tax=Gorillibacterium sp. sgz5001074 TaxID=3446695 RepID=UPI003F6727AA